MCEFTLLESRGRLGREEKIVQIDESKFGKRKYHRGHHVEGQWVFGGIEQNSRKCFLIAVEKRMKQRCYLLFRNGLSREQLSYQIAGKRTVIWRNRVLLTEQQTTQKNLSAKMVTTPTKSKVTGDKRNANFLNSE